MHTGILYVHSWLRWVVLVLLVLAIVQAWMGWKGNKAWTATHKKLNLFTLISIHTQLLLGFALYFIGPWFSQLTSNTKVVMKTRALRYFAVEHLFLMLVAIIVFTIGYGRAKRLTDDNKKHKTAAIFFTIALICILASIPWPFLKNGVGRVLFRF